MKKESRDKLTAWKMLLAYIFKPRFIEISDEDDEEKGGGLPSVDFDEFSVFVPDEQGKIEVWIWQTSGGSYYQPPDASESKFGMYDNITEVIKAIHAYYAQERLSAMFEGFYFDSEHGYIVPEGYRLVRKNEIIKENDQYWNGTEYVQVPKENQFVGYADRGHIIIRAGDPYEDIQVKETLDEIVELEEPDYVGGE